ncbi:3'(2'),5'-bisphosphate nucleotidase [Aeoliella mucimassa]|uniref:3'(2'),5'-bisphosphate nucleotidase n=1 Tax=Aeoliella mucimassa TaxID=2527972 RepID=A0A518AUJ8_9BACT|nr:3'(2'),5'-bisphosphate nucleotidase [Aeoliella mucimassa]QDU58400.1 Histidinol-phosphatase [Aeoliella mucimassa]
MFSTAESQFAIAAVREAALLTRRVQQQLVSPALVKGDKSPVTVADFSAQAIVAKRLAETFPEARLVGEEDAGDLTTSDEGRQTLADIQSFVAENVPGITTDEVCRLIDHGNAQATGTYWTLDPVDGTKGFLRGEQYAVALALIEDGQVVLGVLGCPGLESACQVNLTGPGSLLVALRGQGTWASSLDPADDTWQQLQVADTDDVAQTRIFRSVETAHTNTGQLGELSTAMGVTAEPIPMDSQAKYAVLAAGGGEMLVRLLSHSRPDYRERIWDQAAGSIVVEEAGGTVTDLDGKPLDFAHGTTLATNRGVLATNGKVHQAALDALQSIGA